MISKIIRVILVLLCALSLVLFGDGVFKTLCAGPIKWAIQLSSGGQFSFRDILWQSGKIVFLDAAFAKTIQGKKGCFIETARLDCAFGFDASRRQIRLFVELQEPQIEVHLDLDAKIFHSPSHLSSSLGSWIDWRCTAKNGSLHWPEAHLDARLDFEKTAVSQLGHLVLTKEESQLEIEALQEEEGIRLDASLKDWELALLQPWLDQMEPGLQCKSGLISGLVHCEHLDEKGALVSIHADLQKGKLEAPLRTIGWEKVSCVAEASWNALSQTWEESSYLRLDYKGGVFQQEGAKVHEIEGAFSYYSDVGLSCHLRAVALVEEEASPLTISAKNFWSSALDPWLEIECQFPEGQCQLQGKKGLFAVNIENLQPFWGKWVQMLFPGKWLCDWEWKHGGLSGAFSFEGTDPLFSDFGLSDSLWSSIVPGRLDAAEWLICHKKDPQKYAACKQLSIEFAKTHELGSFSLQDFSLCCQLSSDQQIQLSDWEAWGLLDSTGIKQSEWKGEIHLDFSSLLGIDPFTFRSCFAFCWDKEQGFDLRCEEEPYPFCIRGHESEGLWSLKVEGGEYHFSPEIALQQIHGNLEIDAKHWAIEGAFADWKLKENIYRLDILQCFQWTKDLVFDVRIQRELWDVARWAGTFAEGQVHFDPKRTDILGCEIDVQAFGWRKDAKAAFSIDLTPPCVQLIGKIGAEMGFEIPLFCRSAFQEALSLDFSYEKERGAKWTLKTKQGSLPNEKTAYCLEVQQKEKSWQIDFELGLNSFSQKAHCLLDFDGELWVFREGTFSGTDPFFHALSCSFYGQCDSDGKGQMIFKEGECTSRSEAKDALSMKAKGCVTFDLALLNYEIDFEIADISWKQGRLQIENTGVVHALFSEADGLMCHGIDSSFYVDGQRTFECQINLLHYLFDQNICKLSQAHVHMIEKAFPVLLDLALISPGASSFDPQHEIDFVADFEIDLDRDVYICRVKEGLLPCSGQMRHLQNFWMSYSNKRIQSQFFYAHQSRDVFIKFDMALENWLSGHLILQDSEELSSEKPPLTIDWRYDLEEGLIIDAICGHFAGVEADFYLQALNNHCHLLGKARLDFQKLIPFVPTLLAEFFTELEIGKGYEIKGKLYIDRRKIQDIFFTGLLAGKGVELCGYQFRTFLSELEVKPGEIKLSNAKISDASGLFRMGTMLMEEKPNQPWTFSIPLLTFSEFRPSLLQKVGGAPGTISPLVIRELTFKDISGLLEDKKTYAAHGELFFINSYKREHTIFDLPSDVLGRIIGLDMELLIPVKGTLRYELKEGVFHMTALENSYSEGERSQFFLVHSGQSPTLDLDGNLQIQVKMKQYVLFKLTEAFNILIDGKLNAPQYHLQKKK